MASHSGTFLRRWEIATREKEKRQGRRRSLRCSVELLNDAEENEQRPLTAECLNIGDGGLFAILPANVGVAIGQRYTFRLIIGERGPEPGHRQCVTQKGEIIRLELLLGQEGYADRIGIGVRLFGPRSGIVPMPTIR
ncbi:MAG: hypothetical protein ACUVXJ_03135 [Phycisphaerae bacterium]